jgi:glycosyltransferase involved in cell wall biosynthesis
MIGDQSKEGEMRIIIATSYWKNSDGGGIRTFLINFVDELNRRGTSVDVIFKEGQDPSNYKINDAETNSTFLLKVFHAYAKLRRLRPHVIHMHGDLFYYLVAGYFYKIFHKTTLIYTFHTEPRHDDELSFLWRILLQALLNRCDCVTFVSMALQDKVESIWKLSFKEAIVIYAGVNSEDVDPKCIKEFLKRFEIDQDKIILLSLGMTALSYKAEGLKILIKAFGKMRCKYPNSVLIATRNGSYVEQLRELSIREGLKDSVLFTGNLENPNVALAICDIYTHISLGEGGVSISLLEAMSMGKPIIATSTGGIPEAIVDGYNGILVQPDIDELSHKLYYLIEHKDFARMLGENARKTAVENFSWKKTTDEFMKIYLKKKEK